MMKKQIIRIKKNFRLLTSLIMFGVLLILGILLFIDAKTTYIISATTEQVNFIANNKMDGKWVLKDALIRRDLGDSIEKFTGELEIPSGSKVTIERISYGPIFISIENVDSLNPGAFYKDLSYFEPIYTNLEISILNIKNTTEEGATIVLPLNKIKGEIMTSNPIGREIDNNIPLLRSGSIKLFSQSIFNTGLSSSGSYELELGDQIVIKERTNPASGFIVINEEPNMMLSYNVMGKNAYIIKPGGRQRVIKVNLLQRIINDQFLSFISLSAGIFLVILTILTFYIDYYVFKITLYNGK